MCIENVNLVVSIDEWAPDFTWYLATKDEKGTPNTVQRGIYRENLRNTIHHFFYGKGYEIQDWDWLDVMAA